MCSSRPLLPRRSSGAACLTFVVCLASSLTTAGLLAQNERGSYLRLQTLGEQKDKVTPDVWYTTEQTGEVVYATIFPGPPNSTEIILNEPIFGGAPRQGVHLLGYGDVSTFRPGEAGGLVIDVSAINPSEVKSQTAWVFRLTGFH